METTNGLTPKEEKEIVKYYNAGKARSEIRSKYKITNVQFTRIITQHIQLEKKRKEELYRVQ